MAFLSARVSDELKAGWRIMARSAGLSEGELLRQVMSSILARNAASTTPDGQGRGQQVPRGTVTLKLKAHELAALEAAARSLGWKRNTWAVNLLRRHLFSEPRPTERELTALYESVAQLVAVGRNLNQIAHALHRGSRYGESVTLERLDHLRAAVDQHIERTRVLLNAIEGRYAPMGESLGSASQGGAS